MDQKIRPSLADLQADYDAPAFPELEPGATPAVRVVRARPPTVLLNALPPPIPVIVPDPVATTATAPPPSKPKSRFALQREKEAAEKAAAAEGRAQRFELNLEDEAEEEEEPWRPSSKPSLVKNVLERPVSRATPPKPPTAPGPPRPSPLASRPTGFPASSRGLFPRKPSQPSPAPAPVPPRPLPALDDEYQGEEPEDGDSDSLDGLLASVSQENEDVLRGMSEAEILEEQRQIREELGLSAGVLKMLAARGQRRDKAQETKTQDEEREQAGPTPRSRPLPPGAPAPAAVPSQQLDEEAEEEGTPEYIRRHFFPNEPPNPALDWMRSAPPAAQPDAPASLSGLALYSFDIHGAALPESSAFEHAPHVHDAACGEHHVSSPTSFTIPSLFSLSSSSVPSQRSTAFTVLHRILTHPSKHATALGEKDWNSFRLQLAQKAGWALRDPNVGVVGACIALLADLLQYEAEKQPQAPSALSRLPNAEQPATVLANFLDTTPLPQLASQLSYGALPRPALLQVLSILSSLVSLARTSITPTVTGETLDALFSAPKLLEHLASRFIATPWPSPPSSSSSDLPSTAALRLLTLLASSSRARAKLLVERKLAETPLRFVAIPPWELPPGTAEQTLGYALLEATLELWTALGRYGLATGLRTQAAPLLEGLSERVTELAREGGEPQPWATEYLGLLSVWTTAAVDPHVTAHDITWSTVEGWRDHGAEAAEWALQGEGKEEKNDELLSAAWGLLASWLEGSKVNRSWRGEEERNWLKEGAVGKAFEAGAAGRAKVEAALELLAGGESAGRERAARVAAAALRLSDTYAEASNPPTPQLFELNSELVQRVLRALVHATPSPAPNAVALLLLPRVDLADRLPLTVDLLPLLGAEDAVAARDQVDWLLRVAGSPSNANLAPLSALSPSLEHPSLAHLATLRPFITHLIVTASGGRVVAPLYPTPRDIKLTGCLAPFAPSERVLPPDWPLAALNELLRSATSPVFEQLPAGTPISELQLVRSSLALMRLAASAASTEQAKVAAPAMVYDLIKVFMLEKDNGDMKGSSGADTELFRDEAIQHSLSSLLSSLSVAQQPKPQLLLADARPSFLTIEGVSSDVSSAPFYQLYTDLVGLYDAISLSDRLFGLVLLPPLAMAYPVDFRRLLWTDYAHLLRTLRFHPGEVVPDKQGEGGLSAFLEPREENETLLFAYVDALVSGAVRRNGTPFLHLVAVHHVTAALFAEAANEALRRTAERLAKALVARKAEPVLREVLEYGQGKEGDEVRMPPACFGVVDDTLRKVRVERLRALVGQELEDKLDALVCGR